jgi:hypothetical protein
MRNRSFSGLTLGIAVAAATLVVSAPPVRAEIINGKIRSIGDDGSIVIGARHYPVSDSAKILVASKPVDSSALRPGMNCKVKIAHREAQQLICTRKK